VQCTKCGFDNPAAMKFCGGCGQPLAALCPACGVDSPAGFKFCGACGADLTPPASSTAVPEADEDSGERRQITVAFCDLVGSTDLSGKLDPEDLRDVVRDYQASAAVVVERYKGHIAQYLGDGILIYFGYPTAHEDDPIRTVHAALGIIEAVEALAHRVALPQGLGLQLRIGIHTGLVVAGEVGAGEHRETLAMGETPNLAARLEALAEPGEVVLSRSTERLVATHFATESMGAHELKGILEPVEVFRVVGVSEGLDPFELLPTDQMMPLVGRDREVEQLSDLWSKATEGKGQVVLLTGEPGMGKSRLTRAFRERLDAGKHTYLWARGMAFNESTTLSPMVEMLARLCGIKRDDAPEERFRKLAASLEECGLGYSEEVVLFASMLELPVPEGYPTVDLPPLRKKQRTMEALVRFMEKLAEGRPLLLVVEDLHWVDPSTEEFLEQIVLQGAANPMLSFFTTRPQSDPQWASRSYVTRLNLGNLGDEEAAAMVLRVTGGKALPESVIEQIISKTDGVPLFVEELTKMVLESGVLAERDDHYALEGDLASLAIPSSLQDSLNARLDGLTHGKQVAQTAASIDREFSYGLLAAVWTASEDELGTGLAELVDAEFLFQRGRPPYSSYIFKHALIQDAATASLLRSRRQRIHHKLARTLEAVHRHRTEGAPAPDDVTADVAELAELVDTTPERIAHHYTAAGEAAPAVDWWMVAGLRGLERSANREVIDHMTRALELLEPLDPTPENLDRELSLQTMLGAAYTGARGYAAPEVETAFGRALTLADETGEHGKIFQARLGLWMFQVVRADFPRALEGASDLMAVAVRENDRSYLVEAGFALGCTKFFMGRPAEALAHLEEGIALDGPDRDRSISQRSGQDAGVASLVYVGMCQWMLGNPSAAIARSEQAIRLAEEIQHPYSLVYAKHFSSWIHLWLRRNRQAEELADQVITTSLELGYFWVTLGSIVRGRVLVDAGEIENGLAGMESGLDPFRAAGARLSQTLQLALIAEGHQAAGAPARALEAIREAQTEIAATDERFWEADLKRIEGELVGRGDPVAGDALLREAIQIAQAQGSAAHHLRAALSLNALLESDGRAAEARPVVALARGGFDGGVEWADVEAAERILSGA
jgi:class 3 adenylate cyclase/tetratricopeptide (TPR) repeat protein